MQRRAPRSPSDRCCNGSWSRLTSRPPLRSERRRRSSPLSASSGRVYRTRPAWAGLGLCRAPFAKSARLGQNRRMPVAAESVSSAPALRQLVAIRYVTALREGGSVPAIVEADDGALYVAKFRAAAQGGRALAAEVVVGELARAAGLPVPELAGIEIDAALGRSEPHQEIQELLIASAGLNLAMGYLAGAIGYDVAARRTVDGELASLIVALDVFAANVD